MTVNKITSPVSPLDEIDKINEIIDEKQDTLVSGTNIKTINNNSILGSGNLTIDVLPSQTGQAGKYLTTDGTDTSWSDSITTSLNQKVDKSSLVEAHVVIETYQSGTSWYRLYNSGWCEQGGITANNAGLVSVSLLKNYANTNYGVQLTVKDVNISAGGSGITPYTSSSSLTTSGFQISKYADARQVIWCAYGYIS